MEPQPDGPPRVTPYLLREADTMCPRRLARELERAPGTADPMNRARLRNALLDGIRTWHATGNWPPPPELFAEEHAVLEQAARWYAHHFRDPVDEVSVPLEEPTLLARRQVLLGGWVDLGVVHLDGRRELRQLAWTGRRGRPDPLERPEVRLGVLRLATVGWSPPGPLLVSWVDLLDGTLTQAEVEVPTDLQAFATWLDERVATAQARADDDAVDPGRSCGTCRFVPRCPAHEVVASMVTPRGGLVPGVLALSPSSLESWHRCRREWRDRSLLRLPPSNVDDGPTHGLFLHQLLHHVHRHGSCHDADHVNDTLAAHGADTRTADEVARHAQRCPIGAEALGHEIEWARAHRGPPVFVATARLDAAWVHDGLLDVRDYKTGRVASHPIDEDRSARLQAWVAAPQAAARGLRLRLRYEHLAAEVVDDPEPWEPTDDELAAIETELVTTVSAMRTERDFRGVADEAFCQRCGFRSVCDDSATAAEPTWPVPEIVGGPGGPG